MLSKSKVQKTLKDLPDTFTLDEIVDKLILISSIEEGLEQAEKGETYSTDEAKAILKKWQK